MDTGLSRQIDPILLVRKWYSSQVWCPLSLGNSTALKGSWEQSRWEPAPASPHHPVTHLLFINMSLYYLMKYDAPDPGEMCHKRGDFTCGTKKGICSCPHFVIRKVFKNFPTTPLGFCLTSQQGIRANRMFLGSVPAALRRPTLGSLLCRLHLCSGQVIPLT